jgi:hypothetical protein
MAVFCQNLTLGALSSHSALSMLVGSPFKNFGLFLNTPRIELLGLQLTAYWNNGFEMHLFALLL